MKKIAPQIRQNVKTMFNRGINIKVIARINEISYPTAYRIIHPDTFKKQQNFPNSKLCEECGLLIEGHERCKVCSILVHHRKMCDICKVRSCIDKLEDTILILLDN